MEVHICITYDTHIDTYAYGIQVSYIQMASGISETEPVESSRYHGKQGFIFNVKHDRNVHRPSSQASTAAMRANLVMDNRLVDKKDRIAYKVSPVPPQCGLLVQQKTAPVHLMVVFPRHVPLALGARSTLAGNILWAGLDWARDSLV